MKYCNTPPDSISYRLQIAAKVNLTLSFLGAKHMPYFVYKIAPGVSKIVKNIEPLAEYEKFKEAKIFAKEKRQEEDAESGNIYKVIFAENSIDAEEKLQEQREETIVKEWEK